MTEAAAITWPAVSLTADSRSPSTAPTPAGRVPNDAPWPAESASVT